MKKGHMLDEHGLHDAEASKTEKRKLKRCKILAITLSALMTTSLILLLFAVKHFWHRAPEKIYDVEYKFFGNGEKTTVLMEIDPVNRIETFRTENGTDEVVEIHDFKHGGEITTTIYEQSMLWVPGEKPIEDKEFLKNSKIFDVCKNVSVHWIYPRFLPAPEFQDFEDGEDDVSISANKVVWPQEQRDEKMDVRVMSGNKRQARDLTEEDLPVNDYREVGLEFNPMWDHRGFCCHHCRRGQRYCQRVCEPLLGFYPYPYCYESGRVICRIIMPCNWWVARMLGRV
ncbi:hypothetical protein FKM82_002340 [Ascaphus truei]